LSNYFYKINLYDVIIVYYNLILYLIILRCPKVNTYTHTHNLNETKYIQCPQQLIQDITR